MNVQFSFGGLKKALWSSFEEFNNVFFPTKGKMFCFEIQRKEVKFLKTFQVRFLLYGQENYVFKWVLCNV